MAYIYTEIKRISNFVDSLIAVIYFRIHCSHVFVLRKWKLKYRPTKL